MNFFPDPLHPAVVHFPIVLILLGAAVAVIAMFWRRGKLPGVAATLLALGAVAAWAAVESGENDGGLIEKTGANLEALVDEHQAWADRTLYAAGVAAVAAIGAVLLRRRPRAAGLAGIIAGLAAVAAAYAVYETGHRGGALVYRHAAGVQIAADAKAGGAGMEGAAKVDAGGARSTERDDE